MSDRWGLAPSPLSAEYAGRLRARLGDGLRIAVLADLRRDSAWGLVGRLRDVRADEAYVLLESAGSSPLLPVLKFLAGLTRSRTLAVVDATVEPRPFTRMASRLEALSLLWATAVGFWSALRCYLELRRLDRAGRQPIVSGAQRAFNRVAFLRTNLWFGLKAGGSVGHVAGVINGLARRCARVDVLTPDVVPLVKAPAEVTLIPAARQYGYPYELNYYAYHRRFVAHAASILRRAQVDFLYHRLSLGGYAGAVLARRLRIPLVLEYNGSEVWVSQHWGSPLRFPRLAKLAEDVPLASADLVTTVSGVLGEELLARGVPAERILVHPNGVDPEHFDPARFSPEDRAQLRARYGIGPDDVVCTFVGTFGRWHGVTLLAEAIRELVAADEAWLRARRVRFLLVGDGLYFAAVREALAGAPEPYVTLTGLVPQEEAAGYLAASDILLSPHVPNPDGSRFFGSPTKLFEYMAMAKAIVASDLEQIGDVLQPAARAQALPAEPAADAAAILATPGDRSELLTAIRYLAERPDVRQRLGANARRRVLSAYTWDHNVGAVLERLNKLYE